MGQEIRLDRHLLVSRLGHEFRLRLMLWPFVHLVLLTMLFVASITTFSPDTSISSTHAALRRFYSVEAALEVRDHEGVMEYLQSFIQKTYELSPAMVDITVADSLDPARCMDKDGADVCQNRYWREQFTPGAAGYLDLQRLEQDTLSPSGNIANSQWYCDSSDAARPPPGTCINQSSPLHMAAGQDQGTATTGLLPEEPIVLLPRRDFPYAFVSPLAPVVWQTRGKVEPCDGLGPAYSRSLAAGECKPGVPCAAAKRVSKFHGVKPNSRTGRRQDIFVTYSGQLFKCVNRKELSTEFVDRSWHPWVTFTELTEGRPAVPHNFKGEPVFYKFVSDVAYLQAPVVGGNRVHPDACQGGGGDCAGGQSSRCSDPLEVGSSHPLWSEFEDTGRGFWNCSLRRTWTDQYLGGGVERRNTFLTVETNSLTIAALLITPSGATSPDFLTIVRVTFTINQAGQIKGSAHCSSSPGEISSRFHFLTACTMIVAVLYLASGLVRAVFHKRTKAEHELAGISMRTEVRWCVLDTVIVMLLLIYLSILLYFSQQVTGPDGPAEVFNSAFAEDSRDGYFQALTKIIDHVDEVESYKILGYLIFLTVTVRLVMFTTIHPLISILAQTLSLADVHLTYTVLVLALLLGTFSVMGFWMFSASDSRYGTVGASTTTLLRAAFGEFDIGDSPGFDFMLFLVAYLVLVFFIMMNFFLAIVMDAHSEVMSLLKGAEAPVHRSLLFDLWDLLHTGVLGWLHNWPLHFRLLRACACPLEDASVPVVPQELSSCVGMAPEQARRFCEFYALKVPAASARASGAGAKAESEGEGEGGGESKAAAAAAAAAAATSKAKAEAQTEVQTEAKAEAKAERKRRRTEGEGEGEGESEPAAILNLGITV